MIKQGKSLVPVLIFALCEVMIVLGGQLNDTVVPTDFTVSFYNARQERMTSDGLFNERQTGTIWQDLTPGDEKLAMKVATRRFGQQNIIKNEFIVTRKVNGQFVKYQYVKDFETTPAFPNGREYCNKFPVPKFKDFFYELRNNMTQKDPNNKDLYHYDNGPMDFSRDYINKYWYFGPRHVTQPYVPAMIRTKTLRGTRFSIDNTKNVGFYYRFKPSPAVFNIPYKCLQ
ncbi:uncharacterized protein [Clytia hemisphaerica]|uniref:Secreted protein n=1 Tax=Clytia hemisphaerica TaxID=252671 RepID=A0A7M5X3E7_9CNID